RPFIEHHALRSPGHSRIGHFGPGWQTALGQRLEHLRRPDNRHMSRLADPEYILLNLRHPLETNLDSEVAPGHHHSRYRPAHCRKQNPRKGVNCEAVLDLQDDPGLLGPKAAEFLY